MIYNTPYQDLIATRGIIQNFLECYKMQYGIYPKQKPGVFFSSTSVGLQVDGFRQDLVYRRYSRTQTCVNAKVSRRKQPEEIAKALRFRLNLI